MRDRNELLVSDEEISSSDLFRAIWRRKLIVLLSVIIASCVALAYCFMVAPVYVAKVFVLPPTQSDITPFNYGRGGDSGLKELTVNEVYDAYLRNLQSESLRRKFFKEVYRPGTNQEGRGGSQSEGFERLQNDLSLKAASNDDKSRYVISIGAADPRLAMEWALQYSAMAGQVAQSELVQDLETDAKVKARSLQNEISANLERARMEREDRIARLEEALRVARLVGLQKPPMISTNPSQEVSAAMDGSLMYMRGVEALEAEVENLRKRDSDEPFIRDLRPRQKSMEFYRALKLNVDDARVYQQDGALELPDSPVKPKKLWVFVLGLVAGIVLGVVVAGFLYFRGRYKARSVR
ncbi:LPS O-antigen chain length determinant protein WzzB [Pseudomonas putida]